jgi:hypothetical protein
MSKRKTAFGIAVLFAVALSAFSAASASAAGETAFTCVKENNVNGDRFGAHCLSTGTTEEKYKHVTINQDETTTGIATNAKTLSGTTASTPSILKGTAAGVATAIECTTVSSEEGTFENRVDAGGMFAHAEGKLVYSGCIVTAPAGKGCKVGGGGVITTNKLTGRTINGGKVRIEPVPAKAPIFVEIPIEGCSVGGLNNKFPVEGSVEANTNGATITGTHAEVTTQNKLKFAGQKAGLEGAITLEAHSKAGEETHPLSVTTTAT